MRLPRDYARCMDGVKCPFAKVCCRRTTIATDDPKETYNYASFFDHAASNSPSMLEFSCEHLIVNPDA